MQSHKPMKSGFTFLEVLIALLAAILLISATSSSLITSLKAEQVSGYQRDAAFLVNQLATESRLGLEPTGTVIQAGSEWEINSDDMKVGEGPAAIEWRVWILSPRERPSLTVTFASRL